MLASFSHVAHGIGEESASHDHVLHSLLEGLSRCWSWGGGTRGANKVLDEVEATRGVVESDAFGSETSKYCSSIGLVAFVGGGVQVALSACLISSRSGTVDTEKV